MSLPNFDVDMMRLFKAIYDRGSLTSAAEEMNISIAAASRILSKLRLVFDDELFVRMAYGMTPTNRAKELYEPIRRMLVSYGELFSHPTFHPTTLERTIRIGGVDNAIYSFIRPALRGLFQAAPKMALDLRPLATDFLTSLKTGELDLVFYPTLSVPDEFVTETICTEALVWCARRGHPLTELAVTRPLTEADLSAYRIIRVSLLGGARTKWEVDPKGPFTRTGDIPSKAEEGTAVWTTYFAAAAALTSDSDFLTVLPLRLARDAALSGLVTILGRCDGHETYEPHLIWHSARSGDPMLSWFRSELIRAARSSELIDESLPLIRRV